MAPPGLVGTPAGVSWHHEVNRVVSSLDGFTFVRLRYNFKTDDVLKNFHRKLTPTINPVTVQWPMIMPLF